MSVRAHARWGGPNRTAAAGRRRGGYPAGAARVEAGAAAGAGREGEGEGAGGAALDEGLEPALRAGGKRVIKGYKVL